MCACVCVYVYLESDPDNSTIVCIFFTSGGYLPRVMIYLGRLSTSDGYCLRANLENDANNYFPTHGHESASFVPSTPKRALWSCCEAYASDGAMPQSEQDDSLFHEHTCSKPLNRKDKYLLSTLCFRTNASLQPENDTLALIRAI